MNTEDIRLACLQPFKTYRFSGSSRGKVIKYSELTEVGFQDSDVNVLQACFTPLQGIQVDETLPNHL